MGKLETVVTFFDDDTSYSIPSFGVRNSRHAQPATLAYGGGGRGGVGWRTWRGLSVCLDYGGCEINSTGYLTCLNFVVSQERSDRLINWCDQSRNASIRCRHVIILKPIDHVYLVGYFGIMHAELNLKQVDGNPGCIWVTRLYRI